MDETAKTDLELFDELIKKRDYHRRELQTIESELNVIRNQILYTVYGVKIGTIVRDKNGREFCVSKVSLLYDTKFDKPALYGYPRKKDGTFSKKNQYIGIFGWTVVGGAPV